MGRALTPNEIKLLSEMPDLKYFSDSGRATSLPVDREYLEDLTRRLEALVCDLKRHSKRDNVNSPKGQVEKVEATSPLDTPNRVLARKMIQARRMREKLLGESLFADPAWDILLDLYQAQLLGQRVNVSSACLAANVPATTGLRWLKGMEEQGLLMRHRHNLDGRVWFVSLTPMAMQRMDEYMSWAVTNTRGVLVA